MKNKKIKPPKNDNNCKRCDINSFSVADECYSDTSKLEMYRKQRDEWGFDDTETWHLDKTFALFMIPRLKRYIEVNNGFPSGETEESYNEKLHYIVKTFEEYYIETEEQTSLDKEKERITNVNKAVKLLSDLWLELWW